MISSYIFLKLHLESVYLNAIEKLCSVFIHIVLYSGNMKLTIERISKDLWRSLHILKTSSTHTMESLLHTVEISDTHPGDLYYTF